MALLEEMRSYSGLRRCLISVGLCCLTMAIGFAGGEQRRAIYASLAVMGVAMELLGARLMMKRFKQLFEQASFQSFPPGPIYLTLSGKKVNSSLIRTSSQLRLPQPDVAERRLHGLAIWGMAIAYGSLFAWGIQELNCYKDGFCQTLNVHADLVIVWFALQLSLMGCLILWLYRRDRQLCIEHQLDEVTKSGRFISFQSAVEREFPGFRSIRRNPHPYRKVGLLSVVTVLILAFSHATLLSVSFYFGEILGFIFATFISLWFGYAYCWAKVTAIFEDLYST